MNLVMHFKKENIQILALKAFRKQSVYIKKAQQNGIKSEAKDRKTKYVSPLSLDNTKFHPLLVAQVPEALLALGKNMIFQRHYRVQY